MNSEALIQLLTTSIAQAALSPQLHIEEDYNDSGKLRYVTREGPLSNTIANIANDLLKDDDFKPLLLEKLVDKIDVLADAIINSLADKAVERVRTFGDWEYKINPIFKHAVEVALAKELSNRADLLGDRIDADMISKMNIQVTLSPRKTI